MNVNCVLLEYVLPLIMCVVYEYIDGLKVCFVRVSLKISGEFDDRVWVYIICVGAQITPQSLC